MLASSLKGEEHYLSIGTEGLPSLIVRKSGYLTKRPLGKTTGTPIGSARRRYLVLYSSRIVWFRDAADARASIHKKLGELALDARTTVTLAPARLLVHTPRPKGGKQLLLTDPESELPAWREAVQAAVDALAAHAIGPHRFASMPDLPGDSAPASSSGGSQSARSSAQPTGSALANHFASQSARSTASNDAGKQSKWVALQSAVGPGASSAAAATAAGPAGKALGRAVQIGVDFAQHERAVNRRKIQEALHSGRDRFDSHVNAHTFDLVLVTPLFDVAGYDGDAEPAPAERPEPMTALNALDPRTKREWRLRTMKVGKYIEKRAMEIGFRVESRKSRDKDEMVRRLWAPHSLLREFAAHRREQPGAELLPSERDQQTRQGLSHYSALGRLAGTEYTSLERIHLMLQLLSAPRDAQLADASARLKATLGQSSGSIGAPASASAEVAADRREADCADKVSDAALVAAQRSMMLRLDEMRNYFGEKVALYFAFLETLTNSLLPLALIGTPVALVGQLLYGTADQPGATIYSIFVLVWITTFCHIWKRQEARLQHRWGTAGYEDNESQRRQFTGVEADGFYTHEGWFVDVDRHKILPSLEEGGGGDGAAELGSEIPKAHKFTIEERWPRLVQSMAAILLLTALAAIGAGSLYAVSTLLMTDFTRNGLPSSIDFEWLRPYRTMIGKYSGMVLASIFIAITNAAFAAIARKLTDYENHRTETCYEDAYVLKVAVFQFVNSYIALFYVAFVKTFGVSLLGEDNVEEWCHDLHHFSRTNAQIKRLNDGENPYCMEELSQLLRAFVITSQIMQQVMGFVVPWLLARLRAYHEVWWLMHMDFHEDYDQHARRGDNVEGIGGRLICFHRGLPQWMRLLRGLACPFSGWRGTPSSPWPPSMSVYEEASKLNMFNERSGLHGVINRYQTLIIQIGYVVLFAPAFPIAALVCFVNNLWRMRADAYLLLYNTKRPPYRCAEDIGSFQHLLHFLAALGVATHVGLLVFTSSQLHLIMPFTLFGFTVDKDDKLALLVILEHLLLAAQFVLVKVLQCVLPTLPKQLSIDVAKRELGIHAAVASSSAASAEAVDSGGGGSDPAMPRRQVGPAGRPPSLRTSFSQQQGRELL